LSEHNALWPCEYGKYLYLEYAKARPAGSARRSTLPTGETPVPALFGPGPAPGRRGFPLQTLPGGATGPRREGLM